MARIDRRGALLVVISSIGMLAMFFLDPIPQDPTYHRFADTAEIAGVPNFWNVVSNLPFLTVGLFGFWRYPRLREPQSRLAYLLLCAGIVLVGVGSAYYHYAPTNASLLWDRLPITVAFMALFSMLLGERVIAGYKSMYLWVLVGLGISAALYWAWTEANGIGDLRPYVIVQFLPVALMPLIIYLFPERYLSSHLLLWAFAGYFTAKVLEHLDYQIQNLSGFMSGHPLKHLAAAIAVLCIILSVATESTSTSAKANK